MVCDCEKCLSVESELFDTKMAKWCIGAFHHGYGI
jgi:hypothetical protein